MEQKYCIGTNRGQICWDINRILKDIHEISTPITISVRDAFKLSNFHGNPEYAMTTDCNKPIIIAQLCENKRIILDGNHRLFKADKLGVKEIKCFILSPSQHKQYIIDFDENLYDAIVEEF